MSPRTRVDSGWDDDRQPLISTNTSPLTQPPSRTAAFVPDKLNTLSGVFIPVFLSIWGIPFYIRFGFILGNAGTLGMLGMLVFGYLITSTTALSMSAISTNGRIRAGGAYYMISRCLGPEFGGAIGMVLYIGNVISIAMNALGFVESLMHSVPSLPSDLWIQTGYASSILVVSTVISYMGASIFSQLTFIMFLLMLASIGASFGSMLYNPAYPMSINTFTSNLPPAFHAKDASVLFGILFPACSGILSGASMSGALKDASRSIPRGTLWGIAITGTLYVSAILALSASIPRYVLQQDTAIMFTISQFQVLYHAGLFVSAFYGVFGGILSSAALFQAMLSDNLFPGLGSISTNEAITVTYMLTQCILFTTSSVNSLAPFFTQTNLSTYAILNFACLLLILSGAPNFRPAFVYFGRTTALCGMAMALVAMFVVGVAYAAACMLMSGTLFVLVHYFGEPKNWGDVSHALMYHNVRRMLLRMDRQYSGPSNQSIYANNTAADLKNDQSSAYAKLWRPQIMLVPPPNTQPGDLPCTIKFANDLKKGSLFILAKLEIGSLRAIGANNMLKISAEWAQELEVLGAKGFVRMAVDLNARSGVSGMILGSGIGKLTPNIVMIPFRVSLPLAPSFNVRHFFHTPVDPVPSTWDPVTFLGIIEDALALDKALAITRNFDVNDQLGTCLGTSPITFRDLGAHLNGDVPVIDLWPMSMTLPVWAPAKRRSTGYLRSFPKRRPSLLRGFSSSNPATSDPPTVTDPADISSSLDDVATFTLVLQLGYILSRTSRWRRAKVRLFLLVETRELKIREQRHVQNVLNELRMNEVIDIYVVCLEEERLAGIDAGLTLTESSDSDPNQLDEDPDLMGFDETEEIQFATMHESDDGVPADRARLHPPRKLFSDPGASSVILEEVASSIDTTVMNLGSSIKHGIRRRSGSKAYRTTWDEENVMAQASILQRVVAKYSGSPDSSQLRATVVLTTLPLFPTDASGPGNVDTSVALDFVNVLDSLTSNWPPTVLVAASAGQLSVTTSL